MKRYTLGSSSIGELEKKYVNDVLDRNFISPGPVVAEVEKTCATIHGMKHGLALNSGQSAIHLAIQAIVETRFRHKLNDGTKPLVAVPACTYISTLAAVILAGCDIVLVDVEIPSANMCPTSLVNTIIRQREMGDPINIVVPVHLFGKACNPRIQEICKSYGLFVVEDACESTFTPGIGWGDVLTTSFFSNHLISGGGGGLIMTNDDDLDLYCWKLINHGRSARFDNNDIHRIAEKFHFDTWGHSMKWNDVQAAIVKAQIERKNELYGAREDNAHALWGCLWGWEADYDKIWLPHKDAPFGEPSNHTYMMYPIVLRDSTLDVQNIIHELNDHGIEIRRMMPITNQPIVQDYFKSNLKTEFPNAHYINQHGFYVGCHPELTQEDCAEMGQIIHNALKRECKRLDPGFVAPWEVS